MAAMDESAKVQVSRLENGLRVVEVPMPGVASVSVVVLVGVGSRYETEINMGLAHFYEHLVIMGTENYPTNMIFNEVIEKVGTDFNAMTAEEYTGYYMKTEARHLDMALEMLAELMTKPLLKQSEIERERLVIIEEIKMREDTPQIKVADRLVEVMFAGNGLGLPGAGTEATVSSLKREDFVDLKAKHYVTSNMVVVVSGRVGEGVREKVNKWFNPIEQGVDILLSPFKVDKVGLQVEVVKKPTDQMHLGIGFRGFGRKDKQRYAQGLLSVILGSGFTSRLFQKVRQERSLAYYVGTDTDLFVDTGLFSIDAGVDAKRAEEAVKVIMEELETVKGGEKKITESELRKAKDYLRGKLVLRLEDPLDLAMFHGAQLLLDEEIKSWEKVLEIVEQVTIEEVEAVAKEIFQKDRMGVVVVGQGVTEEDLKRWVS